MLATMTSVKSAARVANVRRRCRRRTLGIVVREETSVTGDGRRTANPDGISDGAVGGIERAAETTGRAREIVGAGGWMQGGLDRNGRGTVRGPSAVRSSLRNVMGSSSSFGS